MGIWDGIIGAIGGGIITSVSAYFLYKKQNKDNSIDELNKLRTEVKAYDLFVSVVLKYTARGSETKEIWKEIKKQIGKNRGKKGGKDGRK